MEALVSDIDLVLYKRGHSLPEGVENGLVSSKQEALAYFYYYLTHFYYRFQVVVFHKTHIAQLHLLDLNNSVNNSRYKHLHWTLLPTFLGFECDRLIFEKKNYFGF